MFDRLTIAAASRERLLARLTLGLFLVWACYLVTVSLSPSLSGGAIGSLTPLAPGTGDVELYRAEIDGIRAGDGNYATSYYTVAAGELRSRGYPTRSVFNWRTPLPMALVAWLPPGVAHGQIGLAALATLWLWFGLIEQALGIRAAIIGAILLIGALLPSVLDSLYVMPEVWSGTLIALSLGLFAAGHRRAGVASGIASLWFRELAAIYVLLAMLSSIQQRRWRELGAWLVGMAAYAAFYGWHISQVLEQIGPDDLAHQQGWLCFGGASFLIKTAQMNCFLLLLPLPVSAIYLACGMFGLASWNTPLGRSIAVVTFAYLLAFSLVGQSFNQYWGSIFAPLLCLGIARFPRALASNWRLARLPSTALVGQAVA